MLHLRGDLLYIQRMLDIKFIREHAGEVRIAITNKGINLNLDELLAADIERSAALRAIEDLNEAKNKLNDEMKMAKTDDERKEIIKKGKEVKEKLADLEPKFKNADEKFMELMLKVPSIPSSDTPLGKDESENKAIRICGTPKEFDFEPKDHVVLGESLGLIDTEQAVKISGARFSYLKGEAVLLEFALIQHTLGILTNPETMKSIADSIRSDYAPRPFIPVVPPVMIRPEVFQRMARLEPKEERYYIPSDDIYLVGSAEHTLGPLHMDEIIPEENLPIRYLGFSTAFRREAGSYGKDMKGILRVHQFDKLEMESFVVPEDGMVEQDFIVAIQEYLMKSLGLPYRVVAICTGDMGAPDVRQFDIETWIPSQKKYRETHTSDYMGDYQARRLATRVRRKDGNIEFVHMNDATAFAVGRTLIAILENYQTADGKIAVPEVLQKYVGKKVIG
jgi:seryl-tRNA synthetase